MTRVALEGVSKVYPGGVEAIRGLDLEIRDRELLVLVGPSGCGKTTTLRMIAGLEEVTSGEVRLGDSSVTHIPPNKRNVAMVFQRDALYPHMTVYGNLAYGLKLHHGGWVQRFWDRWRDPTGTTVGVNPTRGIDDRIRETAALLGIEPLLNRLPRQLSGGERQRVALGRALIRQPAVFLLDEPLANLDARLRLAMRREIRRLHQQTQSTMVYVTHDQIEALALGDRIAVMQGGMIQQVGTPSELYDRPRNRFVATFLGSCPMNLVRGRIHRKNGEVCFESDRGSLRLEKPPIGKTGDKSDSIELGIRAEDIVARKAIAGVTPGREDHLLLPPAMDRGEGQAAVHAEGIVTVVERLGDHALVDVEITGPNMTDEEGSEQLTCQTDPRTSICASDRVRLTIDTRRVHFFDTESGQDLTQ